MIAHTVYVGIITSSADGGPPLRTSVLARNWNSRLHGRTWYSLYPKLYEISLVETSAGRRYDSLEFLRASSKYTRHDRGMQLVVDGGRHPATARRPPMGTRRGAARLGASGLRTSEAPPAAADIDWNWMLVRIRVLIILFAF